jgi:hypothetical protein
MQGGGDLFRLLGKCRARFHFLVRDVEYPDDLAGDLAERLKQALMDQLALLTQDTCTRIMCL